MLRENICKAIKTVFIISLVLFIILGIIIITIQIFSYLTLNGTLSVMVADTIVEPAVILSAIATISGWLYSYIHK